MTSRKTLLVAVDYDWTMKKCHTMAPIMKRIGDLVAAGCETVVNERLEGLLAPVYNLAGPGSRDSHRAPLPGEIQS